MFGRLFLTQAPSEKAVNAPLIAILLVLSMPALFVVQDWVFSRDPGAWTIYGFSPATLSTGGWWPGLLTSMFLHAGWAHALTNAVGALAFAPPSARLMKGARGVFGFLAFYIVCGLIATLGFALIHAGSSAILVGASGAVFGLMGAGLRLLRRRDGTPRPLTDRKFLTPAAVIMAVNAATGLIGFAPGMGRALIAWEAHAFGFVAGALLIGPWLKVFGAKPAFDSGPETRDAVS